jgi:hypothetical protein
MPPKGEGAYRGVHFRSGRKGEKKKEEYRREGG